MRLADRRSFREEVELSEPNRDLQDQGSRLEREFLRLAGPVLGAAAAGELANAVRAAEQLADAGALVRLCIR